MFDDGYNRHLKPPYSSEEEAENALAILDERRRAEEDADTTYEAARQILASLKKKGYVRERGSKKLKLIAVIETDSVEDTLKGDLTKRRRRPREETGVDFPVSFTDRD